MLFPYPLTVDNFLGTFFFNDESEAIFVRELRTQSWDIKTYATYKSVGITWADTDLKKRQQLSKFIGG